MVSGLNRFSECGSYNSFCLVNQIINQCDENNFINHKLLIFREFGCKYTEPLSATK